MLNNFRSCSDSHAATVRTCSSYTMTHGASAPSSLRTMNVRSGPLKKIKRNIRSPSSKNQVRMTIEKIGNDGSSRLTRSIYCRFP